MEVDAIICSMFSNGQQSKHQIDMKLFPQRFIVCRNIDKPSKMQLFLKYFLASCSHFFVYLSASKKFAISHDN